MSLILEALKKAERQHKLGEVPGIKADPQQSEDSASGRTGWVMLILFAAILLALGVYLGSYSPLSQQSTENQPVTAPPSPAYEEEPGKATVSAGAVQPPSSATPTASEPLPESADPVVPLPVPVADRPAPIAKQETGPVREPEPPPPPRPLHEMPSGFVANLPVMSIDIHSYDKRPGKRYVLINMERYREGDYLAEGPLLVEILSDGAVMEHMGERFILPIGNR
ncbi:MAG: general secretion pathway protein GspB [Candidatus Thiodiazotropha sp. (ex Dulcina madagascariensis)]|nr:general secretion pathway protein GspB [Candidatus Thiodiazotropha sp. (ex Dulcina madagascariensis)]MCU7927035.1 general secretion pathway protein GspB [Candidatus Thiodiazotropha sp. (ex Dulcina madagascariensis)]